MNKTREQWAGIDQQADPTETFIAVDMATAAAQGFRDGQAAVEQAAAQDERLRAAFMEGYQQGIDSEFSDPEAAWNRSRTIHLALDLEQARPAQTEQQLAADLYEIGGKLLEIAHTKTKSVSTTLMAPRRDYTLKDARATALVMGERLVGMADRLGRAAPIAQTAPQQSDDSLIANAKALLALDERGSLAPHGIGGLAREVIEKLVARVEQTAPQPEQDDSLNMEPEGANAYLVVDPDDNYHICYVVRSKDQALQHADGGLLAFGPIPQGNDS